jgi:hypothetical protein
MNYFIEFALSTDCLAACSESSYESTSTTAIWPGSNWNNAALLDNLPKNFTDIYMQ